MTTSTTQERAETFHRLHRGGTPLVLVNAWDAVSARVIEEAGAPALATTSAGMAWALGHADGQKIPASEFIAACARICRVVKVPVTVDLERGYGHNADEVRSVVRTLIGHGAVGINIEDGVDRETGLLVSPRDILERIGVLRALATELGVRLFINARTDAYFAPQADPKGRFEEALARARMFAEAGADGIFVPGMDRLEEITRFVSAISLPFNVYAGYPGVPGVEQLAVAGVRRVSLGCGPLQSELALLRRIAVEALSRGRTEAMTSDMLRVGEVNALFETTARGS